MLTRREIFVCAAAFAGSSSLTHGRSPDQPSVPATFPSHDPALAREMVGVSHGNVTRVRELLEAHPALAKAAWDWGYGDWETALGAASHMGNREIAELLLAHGAGPTIFSAAMLGQLDAVRAFVAARPTITRTRGPHGITLMAHAKAGGAAAQDVVAFLAERGDADVAYTNEALSEQDVKALVGTYGFGSQDSDTLAVTAATAGLSVARDGSVERRLFHLGGRVFHPAGAEAVRITFSGSPARATELRVDDGPVRVVAARRD
jgi:hypothetical protein